MIQLLQLAGLSVGNIESTPKIITVTKIASAKQKNDQTKQKCAKLVHQL